VIDVTERKITEGQLRCRARNSKEASFILRKGSVSVIRGAGFQSFGFFEYWSRELFQIYGSTPEGSPHARAVPGHHSPGRRDFMAETVKGMCALAPDST